MVWSAIVLCSPTTENVRSCTLESETLRPHTRFANRTTQEWRSEVKRDLGVKVDNVLAFSVHIRAATAKDNRVIGMLENAFVGRVSGHLEKYVCQSGATSLGIRSKCLETKPRLRKDLDALERVQKER